MLLTIAVPTIAGRERYLASTLKTCVTQQSTDVEFLVSDNSTGTAAEIVRSFNDPRVRYVRPSRFLPMSAHWDFVLSEVRGDSVCFIGDDDGLMPGCTERVNNIIAAVGNVPIHHALCNYYWPDSAAFALRNSIVFYHDDADRAADGWIDSRLFIERLLSGEARYVDGPMIYHNFIPMDLVRGMMRDGGFFRRSVPDV